MSNPLSQYNKLPPFQEIRAAHVEPAVKEVVSECYDRLRELEDPDKKASWQHTMKPLEAILYRLHQVWSPITHLMGVASSPELRQAHEAAQPSIVELKLAINQNKALFEKIESLRNSSEFNLLSQSQKRVIEKRLLKAKNSGISLPEDQRKIFNEKSSRLSFLATQFSNNVLDATKDYEYIVQDEKSLKNVPKSYLNLWQKRYYDQYPKSDKNTAGPWLITLDAPSYIPCMKFVPDENVRREVYTAFVTRASKKPFDNTPVIAEILTLRQDLASLVGYQNYAELVLSERMARDTADVDRLLGSLRESAYPAAESELKKIQSFAKEQGLNREFSAWDLAYYREALKSDKFDFSEEILREYFQLDKVLSGLFSLCHDLFGINIEKKQEQPQLWHEQVSYYEIKDETGKLIAGFFLDPYARPKSKRGGAWMDDCTARFQDEGQERLPVAHLVCNSAAADDQSPALLSFREVQTLFHEFGHGLQHMLTEQDVYESSGINGIEWDAVELPSQFMENWCLEDDVLAKISCHIETGKSLPKTLVEKLKASDNFDAGLATTRQLHFAKIDMELHKNNRDKDIFDFNREIANWASPTPKYEGDRFLCAFSHIFAGAYAAGYYSYKWAEVLSADAFSRFEEEATSPEQRASIGREFRSSVLASGGGEDPMIIFKRFRGREPEVKALLRHNGLV